MIFAICASCGKKKRRPDLRCGACGADPSEDEAELVRNIYLSVFRFEGAEERVVYAQTLGALSADLRAGRAVSFDAAELERLRQQLHTGRRIPALEGVATGLKFGVQLFVILTGAIVLFGLIAFLRRGH